MTISNRRLRAGIFVGILLVGYGNSLSFADDADVQRITVTAGRSTILTPAFDVTRIAVTNPDVADATVVQPREILIDGKKSGTISLIVWGTDRRVQYDLAVEAGVTTLQARLSALFPSEKIQVNATDDTIVLSGSVSSHVVVQRAGEIAQASAPKAKLINMLQTVYTVEAIRAAKRTEEPVR